MQWACWRICGKVPGNVDFLGTVEAANIDEAETVAKLLWPIDWQRGERLDVEIDDEAETVAACVDPVPCPA